ncbi:hypothetical protein BGZ58_008531 [Dissophora ornata]|nr:hypothetical protein BGZ58_008531 [Dissophora ornata]
MENRALVPGGASVETSNTGGDSVNNEIDLERLRTKVQVHRAKAAQERSEAQKLRQEAAELRGDIKQWKEQHQLVFPSSSPPPLTPPPPYQKENQYQHHQQVQYQQPQGQAQQLQTKLDLTMIANVAAQERVRSSEQRAERAEQIAQRKELLAECNDLMALQSEQMIEAIGETSTGLQCKHAGFAPPNVLRHQVDAPKKESLSSSILMLSHSLHCLILADAQAMAAQTEPHEPAFLKQGGQKQENLKYIEVQIKQLEKEEGELEQQMIPCFSDAVHLKSKARRLKEKYARKKDAAAERKKEFRDLKTRARQKRKLAKLLKKTVKELKSEALELEESVELESAEPGPKQEASQEKSEGLQGGIKGTQDLQE